MMRQELTEMEEPGIYNAFIKALKAKLLKGDLGGDRREMWDEIRKNRLGLVEKKVSEISTVGEDEAKLVGFFPPSHEPFYFYQTVFFFSN